MLGKNDILTAAQRRRLLRPSADTVTKGPIEWSSNRKRSLGRISSKENLVNFNVLLEALVWINSIIRHPFITAAQEHCMNYKHGLNGLIQPPTARITPERRNEVGKHQIEGSPQVVAST